MEVDESEVDDMTVMRNDLITHLVANTDIVFKSQQIGEPDLTGKEKTDLVVECLDNKPLNFLPRFSRYMEKSHFEYFRKVYPECSYEVDYYLKECTASKSQTVVKNRRLEAMKRLAMEGDYFTEEEMRKRNPLLYEQLVGKYLTEEEKKDKSSFTRTIEKENGGCKLSSLLMEQYERDIASDLRKEQEDAEEEIETDSEDEFDPDTKEKDDRVLHLWGESKNSLNYIDASGKISEGEKRLLFEEFRSHMYRDFIGGRETDFDYSKVDSNTDYDDLDELDRDAEDSYFATESPEDVEMNVPETSRTPESVKENASVNEVTNDCNNLSSSNGEVHSDICTDSISMIETVQPDAVDVLECNVGDDDPLDLFMAELEEEQTHLQLNCKMKNASIQ